MNNRVLKMLGAIFVAFIICVVGITAWLWSMNHSYEEDKVYVPIFELSEDFVTDVNIIRRVTQCEDLPEFEAKELWYHKIDGYHSEPHIECYFKKKMTEDELKKFFNIKENVFWDSDKDWTLSFSRGWSKKEYMDVPDGMKEDMAVKIEKLSQAGFTLSFWKNINTRPIESDFINKITGATFPSFSVISYRSDIDNVYAKLRFDRLVGGDIVGISQNNSDEIKVDTFINKKRILFSMLRNEQYADLEILSSNPWGCGNGSIPK